MKRIFNALRKDFDDLIKAQNCSLLHMSCHFVGGMCTWVGVEIDS